MRVLITGGYGFIGSHVAERFVQEGEEIFILDNLSTGRRSNIPFKHRSMIVSIEDSNCEKAFQTGRFDVVIHLAAQTSVAESVGNPRGDAKSNLLGLTNMLALSHKFGVKKFILASSAAVYGANTQLPLTETDDCDPISPYGMSKWAGEQYCRKWQQLYGLETLIFRFSNVYGPRQGAGGEGGVISQFLNRAMAGKELVVFGDGGQTRDFIYVGDIADAIYRASYSDLSGVFNLSSHTQTSVNELVDTLRRLHGPFKTSNKEPREGDIYHSTLDNRRLRKDLDWAPRYTMEEGLEKTYEWFKAEKMAVARHARAKNPDSSAKWYKWAAVLRRLLPFAENLLLFALVAWLSGMLSDTLYDLLDLKLFYIILMGILYGNRQAILAVALSTGIYTREMLLNGRDLVSLLYDTDFFFTIAVYLFVGLVVGYTVERKSIQLRYKQRELDVMTEKHKFLNEVYTETRLVKEELQQQIMNNSDSFGKIYAVTRELESLEPEQLFTSTVSVVESILKTNSVSIYSVNKYGSYLRLIAKSGNRFEAPKSIKVEDAAYVQSILGGQKLFVNKELEQGVPLLVAPVISQGRVAAIINLHDVKFEKFTTYYHNLFRITVELVSSALTRALAYVDATANVRYIEGTTILKQDIFKEILDSKKTAKLKYGVDFVLVTPVAPVVNGEDLQKFAQLITKSLRETDYIGMGDSGELLVLLANSSRDDAAFVLDRFRQNGIEMKFTDGALSYVG